MVATGFLNWWPQMSTGHLHRNGFESRCPAKKKTHTLWCGFSFGGDNRTRTCDLMRVKHRRAYRPDQRRSNQPKPVGNQRLFVVSQSRQDDKHQSLTSCLHADGIVAHPTSKVKTIERLFIIFS